MMKDETIYNERYEIHREYKGPINLPYLFTGFKAVLTGSQIETTEIRELNIIFTPISELSFNKFKLDDILFHKYSMSPLILEGIFAPSKISYDKNKNELRYSFDFPNGLETQGNTNLELVSQELKQLLHNVDDQYVIMCVETIYKRLPRK